MPGDGGGDPSSELLSFTLPVLGLLLHGAPFCTHAHHMVLLKDDGEASGLRGRGQGGLFAAS